MSKETKLVRLHKFIADAGITSRRKAEDLIYQGKVKVNGVKVLTQGVKVSPDIDVVEVEGRHVEPNKEEKLYLVMNKPRGYITSNSDPEGRKTVMDLCKGVSSRIFPVGRLDYLSEGLLVLTNDGDFAHQLIHPSSDIEKTYEVKVFGRVTPKLLNQLRQGINFQGEKLAPRSVRIVGELPKKTWLEFRLKEGKNREIRRICEGCGITIDKLKRVAIGALSVTGIAPGNYRLVTKKQLERAIGLTGNGNKTYLAPKKSLKFNPRKRLQAESPLANDEKLQRYRKQNYYQSIKDYKEREAAANAKPVRVKAEPKVTPKANPIN